MRINPVYAAAAALWLSCIVSASAQLSPQAAQNPISVTVDTQTIAPPVSDYEYGMFIEPIRTLMSASLWSEMIDDRKFYFPITSQNPAPEDSGSGGPPRGAELHRWMTVGPAVDLTMDTDQPFVGDQSPRIALDPSTPHGISQTGLALINGAKYTGRIYLRGTPGTKVDVSLEWGDGANMSKTISFALDSDNYKKFPLSLTAGADSDSATIKITATGTGDFHVGAISLMPAGNVDGFRPEVIQVLRQVKSGFWRFGGNFTSGYNWYDGVGDPDKRPPDWDYAWNAMQSNDIGPDEDMELTKLLGVTPYISVNAGFGDAHSAAQEVEYLNGSVNTPMGAWRAKNGHPEPYDVKFWNIGNEPWGSWQLGKTDLNYYVLKHNEFAKEMRKVDPSIVLIASGEMLHADNLTADQKAKYTGDIQPFLGSNDDWYAGFLKSSWGNFDGIAEHWYTSPPKSATAGSAATNAPSDQDLLAFARVPADTVQGEAGEFHLYQKLFPQMIDKNIFMSMDEYAYFGGGFGRGTDLKLALAYGMTLNEMLRHTDFLKMAAFTSGVGLMDYNRTQAVLNTTGLVYKMFSTSFPGAIPVALSGNAPQPKGSSGSPTYPLDMVAALSEDHKTLILSVVNATGSQQGFGLTIGKAPFSGPATLWQLTGSNLDATNRVGQPAQVEIKESDVALGNESVGVAPYSINIYRFPLDNAH
jgi:alpha-L-arabinofuranosidase